MFSYVHAAVSTSKYSLSLYYDCQQIKVHTCTFNVVVASLLSTTVTTVMHDSDI